MHTRKPDVLLIVLDTLRRDRLSIYGHGRETSPAFDHFAQRAALFERAVAPAQWTIPAHASLFTGVYPHQHGLTQANSTLSGALPTLAEILQVNGYHTAAFCNNPLVGVLNNGLQRGFDEFYNYASAIPHRPYDHHKSALRRQFTRWFRPYARRIGNQFAKSDTLFRLSLNPLFVPVWEKYINFKGNTAHAIDDLIAYWDDQHAGVQPASSADQPMFAFVNLMGAHLPYHPPQDDLDRLAPEIKRDRHAYQYMNGFNADGAAWASPPDQPLDEWQRAVLTGFYDAEIAAQDQHLGRLLDHLASSGALDHTVVIIAADHGEGHGEHELFGHGFNVHQELVHVPLAIHIPDMTRGAQVRSSVSTRRLFHTILDLTGSTPPLDAADPNADVRGLSLVNLLTGDSDRETAAFSEAVPVQTFMHVLEHRSPAVIERLRLRETRRAVYEGDHKLILRGDQVEAVFNIAHDPAEVHNLAGDAALAPLITLIEQRLAAFVTNQTAPESAAADTRAQEVDAKAVEHLRALGYIE